MGPVCATCRIGMRCKRNEVWFVKKNDVARNGDLWACPSCNAEVLTGFGSPVYVHTKPWEILMDLANRDEINVIFATDGGS